MQLFILYRREQGFFHFCGVFKNVILAEIFKRDYISLGGADTFIDLIPINLDTDFIIPKNSFMYKIVVSKFKAVKSNAMKMPFFPESIVKCNRQCVEINAKGNEAVMCLWSEHSHSAIMQAESIRNFLIDRDLWQADTDLEYTKYAVD